MTNKPIVSVITPLYNSELFIEKTMQSVKHQSFQNWEMILIDDCSSDSSLQLATELANADQRFRIISLSENSGAAVARNTGIEAALGRYIAFLDSDDVWLPNKLQKQLKFMQKNELAFSCGAYRKVNERGEFLDIARPPVKVDYKSTLKTPRIGCLTAMYDTEITGKVYMPLIRKRQDFGLWLRLLKKVDFVHGIQEPLAEYLVRSDSISASKASAAKYTWRIYREEEGFGLIKSFYYFFNYAIRNGLRSKAPKLAKLLSI
ncbi:glycosyltransferase family 2 protein [Halomonas sp. BLK-85]